MFIKLDLHVHSESRGKTFINATQLRKSLRHNNLDGVAITNFSNISHASWLKEKLREYIIIVGQEIWTKDGHIAGLGLSKQIADFQSAQETVNYIHEQGGIAVAVHPFLHLGIGKRLASLSIDAVEVYNGTIGGLFIFNYLAKRIAQKMRIAQLASTDTTEASLIGRSYTEVMTNDSSSILETIRSGKVRPFKKALPIPFLFILKNILKFRDLEPCLTHAMPCFICGKSLSVRLFKEKFRCLDCGRIEFSRIACCNGHYICIECVVKRSVRKDSVYQR